MSLAGKVGIVTGGAQGIGQALLIPDPFDGVAQGRVGDARRPQVEHALLLGTQALALATRQGAKNGLIVFSASVRPAVSLPPRDA